MTVRDTYDRGPTHGFEAQGYSAAYDKERPKTIKELKATLAGPQKDSTPDDQGAAGRVGGVAQRPE